MRLPPETAAVSGTWRGMPFYDPTTYPPLPHPEPSRWSLIRRTAGFVERHVDSALIFLLCVDGMIAATRGVA